MRRRRMTWGVLGVAALLAAATACGGSAGDGATSGGGVSVVASTDVWGDVVRQIAGASPGSGVAITSIISDPAADPHSYEASTQNRLALSKADLVVENGGGYDHFIDTMLKSSKKASVQVLNAVDVSGKSAPNGGELNEHVWYDFPTVRKVAARVEVALAKARPAGAATYRANQRRFEHRLAALEATETRIKSAHAGAGVAITEPVPLYMLEACGLINKTPSAFSEGIEEGTDVSPAVLKQTEDLFTDHRVRLLAYNEQTSGPETQAVVQSAKKNGVAVVPVTETLPAGKNYITWMRGNLAAIATGLGS